MRLFSHVDQAVPEDQVPDAEAKLKALMMDQETDEATFDKLLSLENCLTDFPVEVQLIGSEVRWNVAWLLKSSLADIRLILNQKMSLDIRSE